MFEAFKKGDIDIYPEGDANHWQRAYDFPAVAKGDVVKEAFKPGLPAGMRFLTLPALRQMLDFPLDMDRVPAEVNRLSNQVLVTTYEREWGKLEH